MKTENDYAPQLPEGQICDCGHPQDKGSPANVNGQTVQGWTWAYSLDHKRRICHACKCAETLDCGHPVGEHSNFTTGHAVTPDNQRICYACVDARQREDLKDRSRPFQAYLSGPDDTRLSVTTWTGGKLMSVTRATPWHIFGSRHNVGLCVRATDCHGKHWSGRGAGRSMSIILRPCK